MNIFTKVLDGFAFFMEWQLVITRTWVPGIWIDLLVRDLCMHLLLCTEFRSASLVGLNVPVLVIQHAAKKETNQDYWNND